MNLTSSRTLHWLARRLPGALGGQRLERAALRAAGVGEIDVARALMRDAFESYCVDGDLDGWLELREQRDVLDAVGRVTHMDSPPERRAA